MTLMETWHSLLKTTCISCHPYNARGNASNAHCESRAKKSWVTLKKGGITKVQDALELGLDKAERKCTQVSYKSDMIFRTEPQYSVLVNLDNLRPTEHGKVNRICLLQDIPSDLALRDKSYKLVGAVDYRNNHYFTFSKKRETSSFEILDDCRKGIFTAKPQEKLTPHLLMNVLV